MWERFRLLPLAATLVALDLPTTLRLTHAAGTAAFVATYAALALALPRAGRLARPLGLVGALAGWSVQAALALVWAPAHPEFMDRADALTLWWARLLRGQDPYSLPTGLGNPISVLPGLHLLAAPFVAAHAVNLIPLVASATLAAVVWRRAGEDAALAAFGAVAATSLPVLVLDAAGRSDLGGNLTLLALVGLLVERDAPTPALGLALGLVAATRPAVWPALAVAGLSLLVRDPRRAARVAAWAAPVLALATTPFLVWNPAVYLHYAPFGVNAGKLGSPSVRDAALVATALAVLVGGWHAARTGRVLAAMLPALAVALAATWLGSGVETSYAALVVVPLLVAWPPHRLVPYVSPYSANHAPTGILAVPQRNFRLVTALMLFQSPPKSKRRT